MKTLSCVCRLLCVALLVALCAPFAHAQNNYQFLRSFGGPGNGQLAAPQSVATDMSGNVYVADTGNNRIEKFDSSGIYLSQFGAAGNGNGQFNGPVGIAIDKSGNIYIADRLNNRIQKFSGNGSNLIQFGTIGSGNGQFQYLNGIAFDSSSNLYIVDSGNNRVHKFGSNGNYLGQFGIAGSGNGQFNGPVGIVIDKSGNIYVSDTNNNRIEIFAPASASVSGTLAFDDISPNATAQNVVFTFRSNDGSADIAQSFAIPVSGKYTVSGLPSKPGALRIKPDKFLAVNISVDLSGGNLTGQNATLEPDDANNDNACDVLDFGTLVNAYGSKANDGTATTTRPPTSTGTGR